jgi:asparagine synthase (glutamine-hydrolysing)
MTREALSPSNVRRQGFFQPEAVTGLLDEHAAGRADNSRKIWALLTFSLWHDRYADGSLPAELDAEQLLAEA